MIQRLQFRWSLRTLLATFVVAALLMSFWLRRMEFLAVANQHRQIGQACLAADFNERKFRGELGPGGSDLITIGFEHVKLAVLHGRAVWQPWVLYASSPPTKNCITVNGRHVVGTDSH